MTPQEWLLYWMNEADPKYKNAGLKWFMTGDDYLSLRLSSDTQNPSFSQPEKEKE